MANRLMKNIIVILILLEILLLTAPSRGPAHEIRKNSVILKEVKELKTPEGALFAEESIYAGGIGGKISSYNPHCQESGITLKELRLPNGAFTFSRGDATIEAKVVPMVAEKSQKCVWRPALGHWKFKYGETNNYQSALHVHMGGDLDIAYQSTGMKIGVEGNVMHYGLSGNPHAVSLSKKRLKKVALEQQGPSLLIQPVLSYQPPDDIIIVQMEVTSKGLIFRPVFNYQVVKP